MSESIKEQLEIMNQQAKELASIYHDAAGKSGVSENEFWVWYALLVLGGEYSQQDICDLWSLPKQTVNSIVSNLAKKEFVSLEAVPGTRNRKIIQLTDAGKSYGASIVMPVYQAEIHVLEQLPDQELQTYITMLGKYISLLKNEIYK